MELGDEEILHVAHLARLHLTEDELGGVRRDLNRVLAYVSKLQQLNLEGVAPTMHIADVTMPLRSDEAQGSLSAAAAIDNAPATRDGMFVVPRIMEGGSAHE